ncbi:MAG: hypothetical protein AAB365_01595 [Patescibacteria group bacterium]
MDALEMFDCQSVNIGIGSNDLFAGKIEGLSAVVFDLYYNRVPADMSIDRCADGFLAGPRMIERLLPLYPNTAFFLFGGALQSIVKAGENVFFLKLVRETTLEKFGKDLTAQMTARLKREEAAALI